ncbi:hypothetical protein [Nocardioides aquiterrae]|uniref:PH domain-containing protein n=1 Tax=Nocardioides aquiterrae TaxID=203799 RepID=A0ABP4FCB5_9ACTN
MQTSDYRLAPALAARFAGALLVLLALLLVLVTLLVVLLGLPVAVLIAVGGAGLAGVVAVYVGFRRMPVVRLGEGGYRVRLVRQVGTDRAAWGEVTEAVTASPGGTPVVVLRLEDGRSTTIPVQMLAADREDFVRDLQAHLQDGHGLRPL